MPDPANPKVHEHPHKRGGSAPSRLRSAGLFTVPYAELSVTSNFSFLCGASHPDELAIRAAELGYQAFAITDTNTLAGIVRAHVAARNAGIALIVGCRLVFQDCPNLSLRVYPTTREAYGRLCRLLTLGKRRAPKGECHLTLDDLPDYQSDLLGVAELTPSLFEGEGRGEGAAHEVNSKPVLLRLREIFDNDRLSLALTRLYFQDDADHIRRVQTLSRRTGILLVVTNDVHYHIPERRALQDVLTCIRHGCTTETAGFRLFANAERHLKTPEEMARLFAEMPEAIARTVTIANRAAAFNLDQIRYEYPDEVCPPGVGPMAYLKQLTWEGAAGRYPAGVPDKVRNQIEHEFKLIEELAYAPYFLTVHDIVVYARSRGILCQGRGAAANSAVCYCLGVTSVDPAHIDVLFERFVSRERNEPPDIDIDFEHERREEVIQYLYAKYGRNRAGLTAVVISYRGRSAVRDVGKALGLSLDTVDRVAKHISHWDHDPFDGDDSAIAQAGLAQEDRTVQHLLRLVRELVGFPRHLSQHVGGFVITRGLLSDLVPIENAAMENRTVIEWDKDDIEAMGMLKVDVLGLGMLTCIQKAFRLIEKWESEKQEVAKESPAQACPGRRLELHTLPPEDPAVYDMICQADTIGVFQIESRAQMTMLPRLKPRCYYDLVIEVAIVRPGPIVGDMVHPFLRRRNGEEKPDYPDEKVERVLKKTLGVPLFQEQAMSLAMVAAGFTAGEAEQLRRSISAWKSHGKDAIPRYRKRFIDGMLSNGYKLEFAEQCFSRLKGFSEYGFPESHAASFALLVYASAWIKRYHPAAFAAALLNSQPMGFYAPAQIVRDAREHGVVVLPVDVNASNWDCALERYEGESSPALRLGMRMIRGFREETAAAITAFIAAHGPVCSLVQLWRGAGISAKALRPLALADAFASLGLTRQRALWELRKLRGGPLPLLDGREDQVDAAAAPSPSRERARVRVQPLRETRIVANDAENTILPPPIESAEVVHDYRAVGLSLKHHPLDFLRDDLQATGVKTIAEIKDEARCPHGTWASVAGIVLVRQRPGTARGVLFMTIEDETGRLDLILRKKIYTQYRLAAIHSQFIVATGRVERSGIVVHLLPTKVEQVNAGHLQMPAHSRDFH